MAGYTVTQLELLEAAIASGVLTVEHQGTRTTYQNLDQMLLLRDQMRSELQGSGALPADSAPRVSYATFSRD